MDTELAQALPHKEASSGILRAVIEKHRRLLTGAGSVGLFLLIWELIGQAEVIDPLFTSYPTLIVNKGLEMFATGEIYDDLWASFQEGTGGYALAVAVGIPLGLAMGRFALINHAVSPFVDALYATPRIALLPLFILWLGIGLWSKVILIFTGAVFPILINSYEGVRNTDPQLIEVAKAYGATERDISFKVVLPSSIPFIIAGLRLAVGRMLISVVVAELYAANKGLGFLIVEAGASFDTSQLFVAVLILATVGVVSTMVIQRVERRVAPWLHERRVE